jgi:hypothetical protein
VLQLGDHDPAGMLEELFVGPIRMFGCRGRRSTRTGLVVGRRLATLRRQREPGSL